MRARIGAAQLRNDLLQIEFGAEKREALTELAGLDNALLLRTIQEYLNMEAPSYIGDCDSDAIGAANPGR